MKRHDISNGIISDETDKCVCVAGAYIPNLTMALAVVSFWVSSLSLSLSLSLCIYIYIYIYTYIYIYIYI